MKREPPALIASDWFRGYINVTDKTRITTITFNTFFFIRLTIFY